MAAAVAALVLVVAPDPGLASPVQEPTTVLPTVVSSTSSSTTAVEATTTTAEATTTTARQATATTARQTTTTRASATTTTTLGTVTTNANVLIPGDGTEGAESTTTTLATATTVSDGGLSDGTLIALVIAGLLLIAVAVSILTWRYWVATRPPLLSEPEGSRVQRRRPAPVR